MFPDPVTVGSIAVGIAPAVWQPRPFPVGASVIRLLGGAKREAS